MAIFNQNNQQRRSNQAGTGYTNIQRILQANQANRLGSVVGGGVQQAGEQARGAINQAGQEFKSEAQKERERQQQEEQRVGRVLGDVSKATDEDVTAFERIRGAQMLGPTEIKNTDELRQKAQEAEQLGKASGTEAGRFGLLQRYVGGGQKYTGGQQRLDALLLGQTASPQLREARQTTLGLGNKVATTETAAQEIGKHLVSRAQGLADSTIDKLENQVIDYDALMEKARVKAEEDRAARHAAHLEQLKSGIITDENLYKALGLKEGTRLFGTDLSKFYQATGKDLATKQNVQTQEDFNRINALRRLSGQSLTGEASAIIPAYTDESQIGAYQNIKDFVYDQAALKGAIESTRQAYGNENTYDMAHIQEALRHIYGTNISDEEHERQLRDFGTSARENNWQRAYWNLGGYGATALGADRPDQGTEFWKNILNYHAGRMRNLTAGLGQQFKSLQPKPTEST